MRLTFPHWRLVVAADAVTTLACITVSIQTFPPEEENKNFPIQDSIGLVKKKKPTQKTSEK